ncbi:uncharacterized protein PAC_02466 [Phialocephala subalpina]|uniref:Uncharacterized protein n=1 Tax=Phialocephala subalpina TaxID=576137 RepID=A0A1L7WIJ6_9HELO|nr:uncharacterized protein PAC_02466 [Phialocephala subalpina]
MSCCSSQQPWISCCSGRIRPFILNQCHSSSRIPGSCTSTCSCWGFCWQFDTAALASNNHTPPTSLNPALQYLVHPAPRLVATTTTALPNGNSPDSSSTIVPPAPSTSAPASNVVVKLPLADPPQPPYSLNPYISEVQPEPLVEFKCFTKLPIEIRIPVQRKAIGRGKAKRTFYWDRLVPAILQACKESRKEYLEVDRVGELTEEKRTDLERRRREHPVYKLFFTGNNFACGSVGRGHHTTQMLEEEKGLLKSNKRNP